MTEFATVRKLNLLVIDDDPINTKLVVHILQQHMDGKLNVHGTSNPTEARDWLNQHCCDILISDIEMPGINGLEMLRIAKAKNAWTEVIFLTGHSTWDRIAEAIENGAADYLLKPIVADDLVQVVTQECARIARWQKALRRTFQAAAIN